MLATASTTKGENAISAGWPKLLRAGLKTRPYIKGYFRKNDIYGDNLFNGYLGISRSERRLF